MASIMTIAAIVTKQQVCHQQRSRKTKKHENQIVFFYCIQSKQQSGRNKRIESIYFRHCGQSRANETLNSMSFSMFAMHQRNDLRITPRR